MLFTGWEGIASSLALFCLVWVLVLLKTPEKNFTFERNAGDFEKFMAVYLDIAKFTLTLAGGGIVLVVSSTALGPGKKLPPNYASPLLVLAMSIFYGILFMPSLVLDYEGFKQNIKKYDRPAYIKNQTLGFSALVSFCLGYGWLIFAAVQG